MYSNVTTLGGWAEVQPVVTVGVENVEVLKYNLKAIFPTSQPWLAQCWGSRDGENISAQMSRARGDTEVAAAHCDNI